MVFFETGEDDDPHTYLAPHPAALAGGRRRRGSARAQRAEHGWHDDWLRPPTREPDHRIDLAIVSCPEFVRLVDPCRLGPVTAVSADGAAQVISGDDVHRPAGTGQASIWYQ